MYENAKYNKKQVAKIRSTMPNAGKTNTEQEESDISSPSS